MSMEENAKLICRILAPPMVIVTPLVFLGGVYLYLTHPSAANVSTFDALFFSVSNIAGFVFSVWFCRVQLGWFRKKDS